jgi:hypothetical protein
MKELKQQIAIAESCGWTYTKTVHNPDPTAYGRHPTHTDDVSWALPLPNYLNDLNAMHEAEKVLLQHMAKWWNYTSQLAAANSTLGTGGEAHATAKQRAEAFLRTIGKWEETE